MDDKAARDRKLDELQRSIAHNLPLLIQELLLQRGLDAAVRSSSAFAAGNARLRIVIEFQKQPDRGRLTCSLESDDPKATDTLLSYDLGSGVFALDQEASGPVN